VAVWGDIDKDPMGEVLVSVKKRKLMRSDHMKDEDSKDQVIRDPIGRKPSTSI
jgi:hypothetical protein